MHTNVTGDFQSFLFPYTQKGVLYVRKCEQNGRLGLFLFCILKNVIQMLHSSLLLNPCSLICPAYYHVVLSVSGSRRQINSDRWEKEKSYRILVQFKILVLPSGAAQAGRSLWAEPQDGQLDHVDWDRLTGQDVGLCMSPVWCGPWLAG